MFRLTNALRSYREAGPLNEQINLLGFIDDHVFLTKSGDLGMVLSVRGVDYEGLDGNAIDQYTKRLEAAFKVLDDQCRIYQYLFKRKNPRIPYCEYADPVVNAAIRNRIAYFKSKAESLYSLTIFYVVVLETAQRERYLRRIFSNSSSNDNGNRAEPRQRRGEPDRIAVSNRRAQSVDIALGGGIPPLVLGFGINHEAVSPIANRLSCDPRFR